MKESSAIFRNFDGAIKDSVDVNTQAYFQRLYLFGLDVAKRFFKIMQPLVVCHTLISCRHIYNGVILGARSR